MPTLALFSGQLVVALLALFDGAANAQPSLPSQLGRLASTPEPAETTAIREWLESRSSPPPHAEAPFMNSFSETSAAGRRDKRPERAFESGRAVAGSWPEMTDRTVADLALIQEARTIRAQYHNDRDFQTAPLYTYGMPVSLGIPEKEPFKVEFLKGPPDGAGAYRLDEDTVRYVVQAEVRPNDGYEYTVNDDVRLRGAVIQYIDLDAAVGAGGPFLPKGSGLVYDKIVGADGQTPISGGLDLIFNMPLTDASREVLFDPEGWNMSETTGLVRPCSAELSEPWPFAESVGTADRLFVANQEDTDIEFSVGAVPVVVDLAERTLYQVPQLGFGKTEKSVQVSTGEPDHVAFLTAHYAGGPTQPPPAGRRPAFIELLDGTNLTVGEGQDIDVGAFELLYIGKKDPEGDFLGRNGFRDGQLYVFAQDSGFSYDVCDQHGETFPGSFVKIPFDPDYSQLEGLSREETIAWFQANANEALMMKAVTDVARGKVHNRMGQGKSEHNAVNPVPVSFKGEVYAKGTLAGKAFTDGNFIGVFDMSGVGESLAAGELPESIPASMTVVVPCIVVQDEENPDVPGYDATYLHQPDSLYWLGDGKLYVGEDTKQVGDKLVIVDPDAATQEGAFQDGRFVGDAAPQLVARLPMRSLTLFDKDNVLGSADRGPQDVEVSGSVDLSGILNVEIDPDSAAGYYGYELENDGSLFAWQIQLHSQRDMEEVVEKGQILITRPVDEHGNLLAGRPGVAFTN